jgi:hypothetical protein
MAIDTKDLNGIGWASGNKTRRLALKAADAALAMSLPKDEVLNKLEGLQNNPDSFEADLIFSDVARRVAARRTE